MSNIIQFELLPPFFGNTKILKGDGLPLVPDIEKLLDFAKGDLGIAKKIQKTSLLQGMTRTSTFMTPQILDIYTQSAGLKLKKDSSYYVKGGKLKITPDDFDIEGDNVGLESLEKTVIQTIFENMGPYSKMILTISEVLPDIEDVIARVLALPCLPIISLKSMKPIINPRALGYRKGEIREKQRQFSGLLSQTDNTDKDPYQDAENGTDLSSKPSGTETIYGDSSSSEYDWEIVSTEYSTGFYIPSIKYQVSYRDILIPGLNIDSGQNSNIDEDEDLKPNAIIFDAYKIKTTKRGNSKIEYNVVKISESKLPNWVKSYKWKGSWSRVSYSSGSISKYKNVYTDYTAKQGLNDFPDDETKRREAIDLVNSVNYSQVIEAGTKGITFWTGRKIWDNLKKVKEYKTTTPSSFNNMILTNEYNIGTDNNDIIKLLNKPKVMFLPKTIIVKKNGINEEVVIDPEDYNLQWLRLVRKRDLNTESVNTLKPLAGNYLGYNTSDILKSGEYIKGDDAYGRILNINVSNDAYNVDPILSKRSDGTYRKFNNLTLTYGGEWDARSGLVKVSPTSDTNKEIELTDIGVYYKVSISGNYKLETINELLDSSGELSNWSTGDIVIKTKDGWVKVTDNSDINDSNINELEGSNVSVEEISLSGKKTKVIYTETMYILEGVKKTLKQEGIGNSKQKKSGGDSGGGYYKTPDFFSSIPKFLKVIIKIATKLLPQIQDVLKLISNPFKIIMDQIFGKLEVNFENFSSDFMSKFSQIKNINGKYERKNFIESDPLLSKYVSVDDEYKYKFIFDGFAIIDLFGFGFGIDLQNFIPKLKIETAKGGDGKSIKPDTKPPITNGDGESSINGSQLEDINCLTNDEKQIKDEKINELLNRANSLINLATKGEKPDIDLGSDALIKMKLAQIFDPTNIPLGEKAQELKNQLNINTQPLIDFLLGLVSMPLKMVVGIVEYILDFFKSLTNPMTLAPKLIEFLSFKWFLEFFKPTFILDLIGIKINPSLMGKFLEDAKNSKDLTKKYNLAEIFSVPFMPKLPTVNKEELEAMKDKPLQMITSFLVLIEEIINAVICFLWDLLNLDLLLGPCIKVKFSNLVTQNLSPEQMNEALNSSFDKYVQNADIDPSEREPISNSDDNFVYEYVVKTPDGEVIVKGLDYVNLNEFRKENPFYSYTYNF